MDGSSAKRRTTVTLPAATLHSMKRLANRRKVHLNVILNEALEEGLRHQLAMEQAEAFVQRMGRAFGGLTEEELLMVNGIDLAGKK
ncbi:MAG: hypothetical protein JNL98_03505 [Bryobacterales bacterium]|nr:hypothetical protein [Bryobacterales bacterium]